MKEKVISHNKFVRISSGNKKSPKSLEFLSENGTTAKKFPFFQAFFLLKEV